MARIENNDDHPVFSHEIDGYRYSFSVLGFPADKYQWLCEVLGRHMDAIHQRATVSATERTQKRIREAIGLIEPSVVVY
jgi:hypothetical protein